MIQFDINEPSIFTEMVPVIGVEAIVAHACLRYTRD